MPWLTKGLPQNPIKITEDDIELVANHFPFSGEYGKAFGHYKEFQKDEEKTKQQSSIRQ